MTKEIKIILEVGASNKAKGNCFEDLIRKLLSIHQYEIRGNINFSGMEIDLVAEHKHKTETLYVECKAKEKVSSDELSKFCFNVDFKEVDYGYFFRTQDLESQAGALLSEIRVKAKYKNLSFFEPNDIIQMLKDAKMVFEPGQYLNTMSISKTILAVTYIGDYFIYLINESNAYPTKFYLINANQNDKNISAETIDVLKNRIDDIKNLTVITSNLNSVKKEEKKYTIDSLIETISEVQESEHWYDYLPASSENKHFVGRDGIRTQILDYFKEIHTGKSKKRIFYLNGKSGWGKSSLVLEIKGRCRNKHYKNKFYALAIDTRSATSDNFVALSFKKLLNSSLDSGFLSKTMFDRDITFTTNTELLTSGSVKFFLQRLSAESKFLILIFDQFEDVFRKKDLFKSFYKFLSDVTDSKPNIIVGFSWKTEIIIPIDHEAYSYWQQAKEQAKEFTITEFGEKEIDGVIKQLEESVGPLDKSIKDRIKESSQGLPWLTKKLCIHIFDQIQLGLAKENLIESNLNIADLFKKDEERIEGNELKALKLIAKRAYDGNFFEETEVGDLIENKVIESLLHKRLIIRSGVNYNIYWDIFRDYLVTGVIPIIGESFLLRQMVNSCLDVFLLFESVEKKETLSQLSHKHSKGIGEEALYNILLELRNIGLVQKENEYFKITREVDISKEGFIKYITDKFQNYTPYLVLKKANHNKITKDTILQVLKSTFKQDFQDTTWDAYAKTLISWFVMSNIDIRNKIIEPQKGRSNPRLNSLNKEELLPRTSFKEVIGALPLLNIEEPAINKNIYRDLYLTDIIDGNKKLTDFGRKVIASDKSSQKKLLKEKILVLDKMTQLNLIMEKEHKIKANDLIELLPTDFFGGKELTTKKIYATKAISWLKFKS